MKPNDKQEKKIDVDRVVEYLRRAFAAAQEKFVEKRDGYKNGKGTTLYQYQVDFCYLIDEIQRGPTFSVPKVIQDANDLIARLEQET